VIKDRTLILLQREKAIRPSFCKKLLAAMNEGIRQPRPSPDYPYRDSHPLLKGEGYGGFINIEITHDF
jgi:hypothetical protein